MAIGEVVKWYNSLLEATLLDLYKTQYSAARIFVLNRYKFLNDVLRDPMKYGFLPDITHVACCGGGDEFNASVVCGGQLPCKNPQEHVYFDFVHFTDRFNKQEIQAFSLTEEYIISNHYKQTSLLDVCGCDCYT
ncbi:GDSL esterase/lipase At5g45670 [Selaginella moellendorffii]|uniref:GDSL esterase/lipase At5g45670 n=1 Tax=Selaginella moellendorffii TaxID=88036 RepID=UPI000D1C7811|nr:GDSL esterase/lipase At5g45670 [Selaginella moellendorffii]|eukprot:XP_024527252.1 GDSL esterase/lipase At5g45670 [Selaginella moellendorffii]